MIKIHGCLENDMEFLFSPSTRHRHSNRNSVLLSADVFIPHIKKEEILVTRGKKVEGCQLSVFKMIVWHLIVCPKTVRAIMTTQL